LTTQINVKVFNNNVEKAIRVLKKKMLKEGIIKELKERRYYEKPSEKKLKEQKENIRRWRKAQKRRMERD
jgi:small subunit ribosomal protein S21|tara:strand:+ start:2404 stop:2613 length:210 start_codon:yes stop_codon:yes gene_type:complete